MPGKCEIVAIDYEPQYARELVKMWRSSFEHALGITDPNPIEAQLQFLEEKLVRENTVKLAFEKDGSAIVGFIAYTPETISQIYVDVNYQNRRIGSMLLELAKQASMGRLRLFTFEVNTKAQRFYEKHGFRVIARGNENMWNLEDIEYEWLASENPK